MGWGVGVVGNIVVSGWEYQIMLILSITISSTLRIQDIFFISRIELYIYLLNIATLLLLGHLPWPA